MNTQRTLQREITIHGIGLHTGEDCAIKISPAAAGVGVVFRIKDELIPVSHLTLNGSPLGTNIKGVNNTFKTVEHLLSALIGSGVTDVYITSSDQEVPILDGSAAEFLNQFRAAGIRNLREKERKPLNKTIEVVDGAKLVRIEPRNDNKCIIKFEIDFNNQAVKKMPQNIIYEHSQQNYNLMLAYARTFGFNKDLKSLISQNLCLGGSLLNAILIDDHRVVNKDGLRFDNEIVAHKALDIIGDLHPIFSEYSGFTLTAKQAGHSINNIFLRKFYQ